MLADFQQLSGLTLSIGESDGNDIKDPIQSSLHFRNPKDMPKFQRKPAMGVDSLLE